MPLWSTRRVALASSGLSATLLFSRVLCAQTTVPPQAVGGGDPAAPYEVTVRGARHASEDTGANAIRAQSARSVPGTFGDPFQSLLAMPGVAPMASGLPYFYVRGAPPADTGYFLDGIPLPTLFHIGPGPSYVPPALLDRVDFFPSTAPARFGRFVGGTISAETTAPRSAARGEGSVRLFDASAFVESP